MCTRTRAKTGGARWPWGVGLAVVALLAGGRAAAQPRETDRVRLGNIVLTITRVDAGMVDGERTPLRCNEPGTRFAIPHGSAISMQMHDETRRELVKEMGLASEAAEGHDASSFRNALLARSTRFSQARLVGRIAGLIDVRQERCFNQTVLQRYRKYRYSGSPSWVKPGWFSTDLREFYWDENGEAEYFVEAQYDETCALDCVIDGKQGPVLGRDGKPVWARVEAKAGTTYVVPLYYDRAGRIRDILPLLPPAAQAEVAAEGGGLLASLTAGDAQ